MAKENDCKYYYSDFLARRTINSSFEKERGESLQIALPEDMIWSMRAFEDHGKLFYFHRHYFSAEQTFAFYVTMAEHAGEADKYLAKMTLKHQNDERKSIPITQNVISIDSAPTDIKAVLASRSVIFVHWRTMSGFLKAKGENQTTHGKPD